MEGDGVPCKDWGEECLGRWSSVWLKRINKGRRTEDEVAEVTEDHFR